MWRGVEPSLLPRLHHDSTHHRRRRPLALGSSNMNCVQCIQVVILKDERAREEEKGDVRVGWGRRRRRRRGGGARRTVQRSDLLTKTMIANTPTALCTCLLHRHMFYIVLCFSAFRFVCFSHLYSHSFCIILYISQALCKISPACLALQRKSLRIGLQRVERCYRRLYEPTVRVVKKVGKNTRRKKKKKREEKGRLEGHTMCKIYIYTFGLVYALC